VKHGDVNANIPRGDDPQTLTLEDAVALIAARAAKSPAKTKPAARAKPAAKAKATPKAKAAPKAKAVAATRARAPRKSSPES
jgi:DNA topoisomerase-1